MNLTLPLKQIAKKLPVFVQENSQTILTILAAGGVVTTTFCAIKASPDAKGIIEAAKEELKRDDITEEEVKALKRSTAVEVGKAYVPTLISMTTTITCIFGAHSVSQRKHAALAAAYSISETALAEYQEKTKQILGKKKEQDLRDEIAKDKILKNPPEEGKIIFTGNGSYLCYDAVSGRYFHSDINKIEKAINNINQRILTEMFVSLNELYDEYKLPSISIGDDLGWNVDCLIELSPSYHSNEDGVPCMVIDYLHGPVPLR